MRDKRMDVRAADYRQGRMGVKCRSAIEEMTLTSFSQRRSPLPFGLAYLCHSFEFRWKGSREMQRVGPLVSLSKSPTICHQKSEESTPAWLGFFVCLEFNLVVVVVIANEIQGFRCNGSSGSDGYLKLA